MFSLPLWALKVANDVAVNVGTESSQISSKICVFRRWTKVLRVLN